LPGITEFVVDASGFFVNYGIQLLAAVLLLAIGFRQYLRTESGRRRIVSLGLATPVAGEFLVQLAMYRFASSLALLLKSGIPMLETLAVLEGIFHRNPVYRDAVNHAHGSVAGGRPLASSLEDTGLFTTMITNMVRIGEETGQLAVVMEQIVPYYKEKMEAIIAKVTKLLEPVIIIGMGGAVAGLMLAIYLPMFELAGKIH
jgi:type IV pilus assembly protein PilC